MTVRTLPLCLIALLVPALLVAGLTTQRAEAQDFELDDDGEPGLYLDNAVSIVEMVRRVARRTNQIFLYDPAQLRGREVHVLAEGAQMTPEKEYNFLLALLRQIDFTITEYGENSADNVKIFTIKPVQQAGNEVGLTNRSIDDLQETARFVTVIVHLQFADQNSVQRALLNLSTRPGGVIQPIMGVNAVLISDFEFQIKRMAELLRILDRPGPQLDMTVIPVQHAQAQEIAGTVTNLVNARMQQQRGQQPAQPGDQIVLEADARTNAIIVQALPENIQLVRQLISRLDIEIPEEVRGRIHIYHCRHADASELASTLEQVVTQEAFTFRDRPDGESRRPSTPDGERPRFTGDPSQQDSYQVSIVADENTNSLIITATPHDYLEIRRILNEMDVRKPQVMIEAAILEVNAEDSLEFGIELAMIDQANGDVGIFASNQFGFSEIVDADGVPITGAGGVPAGKTPNFTSGLTLALSVNDFFSIPALLKATETVTDANILSQPRLLTNDNRQARLEITRGEPTITTTTTQTTDQAGFGGYEEAGISFEITPHISAETGDYLRLDINLEVSDFASRPAGIPAEAPPPRNTRVYTGEVTIPNGGTIVVGGLSQTQSTHSTTQVPILGDIPLIGELFKFRTKRTRRTNLYLFIRPIILRDEDFADLREMSNEALDLAELQTSRSMTPQQAEFFRQARKEEAQFGVADEGRMHREYRYHGVNENFADRYKAEQRAAERREMEWEAQRNAWDRSNGNGNGNRRE